MCKMLTAFLAKLKFLQVTQVWWYLENKPGRYLRITVNLSEC